MKDDYTAWFAAINANWNDRYILNITGRRDGSSRFPAGERYGNFGAIAAAWLFTKEGFTRRLLPILSHGKLKLSQGVTGNNQLGDRSLQYIAGTAVQRFQSLPGQYPTKPTGQGWEKTSKTELSLDLGFWNNRLLLTATAYRHRSHNILLTDSAQISSTTSPAPWPITLENRGYELTISGTVCENPNFAWQLSANWTFPISRLAAFPKLKESTYADRLVVGQSINVLKALRYKGVDSYTGLYTFADVNHDGHIDDSDRTVVGSFDVTGFGGIDNNFRWKGFRLELLIDARIQTGVNPLAPLFFNSPPGSIYRSGLASNEPTAYLDHWRHPNDHATYQKPFAAPNPDADTAISRYLASSALFANASFLRLRKLALAYDLPAATLRRMHLSSLTLFINAQNLLQVSPYKIANPETQGLLVLGPMKTVEAGFRLSL